MGFSCECSIKSTHDLLLYCSLARLLQNIVLALKLPVRIGLVYIAGQTLRLASIVFGCIDDFKTGYNSMNSKARMHCVCIYCHVYNQFQEVSGL